ncbi:MAG: Asp23/Gls24 family envelope stress response protein [Verrucomicrobia bacterium]|nr:Asp23/Gls24 family envelope stress response protein [Verrucomicrobiota bacterium]
MHDQLKKIDKKEMDLPDTIFIWDIETKVFQSIITQCLSKIEGVALLEGSFIDNLLGRDVNDGVKGIHVEQDQKQHSIQVKIEITVAYGVAIPQKAEEIQEKVAEEISQLTGLHVGTVHVVFKNLIPNKNPLQSNEELAVSSGRYED